MYGHDNDETAQIVLLKDKGPFKAGEQVTAHIWSNMDSGEWCAEVRQQIGDPILLGQLRWGGWAWAERAQLVES